MHNRLNYLLASQLVWSALIAVVVFLRSSVITLITLTNGILEIIE